MHHSSLLYLEELASEHPKTLKAKLEFANAEQLLEWYQREDGENVFMQCSKAKSFKQAWKGYAMEYNKKKAASFWYILPTTTGWVINKFWYNRDNEVFFRLVFYRNKEELDILSTEDMSVTPEKLRAWYAKEGKTIVEACKASPDFAETWKERITEHNAIYVVKNLFLIPTTINGIVLVFGVKVASIHNMIALLAGEDMSKIDLVRKKSPYLTAEEIRHWYNNEWGREMIHNCQISGSFTKTWRAYADEYNRKIDFKWGAQLPNNKVGLVTRFGGSLYTIPEIVRLLEDLPEQSPVLEQIGEKVQGIIRTTLESKRAARIKERLLQQRMEQEAIAKQKQLEQAAIQEQKRLEQEARILQKEKKKAEGLERPKNPKKIGRPKKAEASITAKRNTRKKVYVALDNSIPLEEGEEIPEIPKTPKTPVQKTEPEIFSEFMIAFAKRFPFFLNIPRKFYTPFRQFITNLEDIYSGEPKLNFESIGVAISGNTMTIQIRKSYLYEHSGEVILQIFQETCEQYNILLESNDRLSFVELDIHMDF